MNGKSNIILSWTEKIKNCNKTRNFTVERKIIQICRKIIQEKGSVRLLTGALWNKLSIGYQNNNVHMDPSWYAKEDIKTMLSITRVTYRRTQSNWSPLTFNPQEQKMVQNFLLRSFAKRKFIISDKGDKISFKSNEKLYLS